MFNMGQSDRLGARKSAAIENPLFYQTVTFLPAVGAAKLALFAVPGNFCRGELSFV